MKLKDKVVLITEGGSPVGRAVAELFAAEGVRVVCAAADPVSRSAVAAEVAETAAKHGRLDILVHNNNEVVYAPFEKASDEDFDRAMAVNLKSAFYYAQAAGPLMKKAKAGRIIFISSIHDEKPQGAAFAYSVAKGGLKNLAKELVLDMRYDGVKINIVQTGPMSEDGAPFTGRESPLYEHVRYRIDNQNVGTPEDVARAALYFAADAEFANGAELKLDGGFLLSYIHGRRPSPEQQAAHDREMAAKGGVQ